jgi:hypothetical protein
MSSTRVEARSPGRPSSSSPSLVSGQPWGIFVEPVRRLLITALKPRARSTAWLSLRTAVGGGHKPGLHDPAKKPTAYERLAMKQLAHFFATRVVSAIWPMRVRVRVWLDDDASPHGNRAAPTPRERNCAPGSPQLDPQDMAQS